MRAFLFMFDIQSNEDMTATHISEASLEDSSPSLNVLSSEFDSLSMQVKAVRSLIVVQTGY
jgi:hypothetical protein